MFFLLCKYGVREKKEKVLKVFEKNVSWDMDKAVVLSNKREEETRIPYRDIELLWPSFRELETFLDLQNPERVKTYE